MATISKQAGEAHVACLHARVVAHRSGIFLPLIQPVSFKPQRIRCLSVGRWVVLVHERRWEAGLPSQTILSIVITICSVFVTTAET